MNKSIGFLVRMMVVISFLLTSCGKKKNSETAFINMSGEHICVSIKNLIKEVNRRVNAGEVLSENIKNLGGVSWLEGYVVDSLNSDIILVGKNQKNRPPYQLSDLMDNYKNVFENNTPPYCSLDPKPENILKLNQVFNSNLLKGKTIDEKVAILSEAIGGQMTVIGGIPKNSNHAFVMINADYHMKKVTQGLIKLPGIMSCIDLRMKEAKESGRMNISDPNSSSMSRFWFHIKEKDNKVYPNFIESKNIVCIAECPIVLLTESQIADEKGNLNDDKKKDNPITIEFAKTMSNNFSKLTDSVKVYAELENLFRLNSLLRAAKFRLENSRTCKNIDGLINSISYASNNEMPESLPGLVNLKEYKVSKKDKNYISTETSIFMVCGGVEMNMKVKNESIVQEESLGIFQNKVVHYRPNNDAYIWNIYI